MRRRGDRGAVLVLVALGIAAFIAMAVVAVDVGRLATTATEVQSAADGAAAAGATALIRGGGAAGAASEARAVAAANHVEGQGANAFITAVTAGRYDQPSATFTTATQAVSAVRVQASATVQNILAAAIGDPTSTVQKTSVGTFTGLRTATPTLPFAIGDCRFQTLAQCFGDDACLPRPTRSPRAATRTAWLLFSGGTSNVRRYLPRECGGTRTPPQLTVGNTVRINQSMIASVLTALRNCVQPGRSEFLVPVLDCRRNNIGTTVTGFATLVIDSVTTSGANRGIAAHGVFRQLVGVPNGCEKCGTGFVRLVD